MHRQLRPQPNRRGRAEPKGSGTLYRGERRLASSGSGQPYALEVLAESGIKWTGHRPRGLDGLEREQWDFIITVCDKAREMCPVFPGQPILAHWGMPDPAAVEGDDEQLFEELARRNKELGAQGKKDYDRIFHRWLFGVSVFLASMLALQFLIHFAITGTWTSQRRKPPVPTMPGPPA